MRGKAKSRKALHTLISRVLGDGRELGWWPEFDAENGDMFVEEEAFRRSLPVDSLRPFLTLPYRHSLTTLEYVAGGRHSGQVEAILFGTGAKLGGWDAFTLLYRAPTGKGELPFLFSGQLVYVGSGPHRKTVTVACILRGTKPAGRPEDCKTQNCFYVVVQDDSGFQYTALQHVQIRDRQKCPHFGAAFNDLWTEHLPYNGYPSNKHLLEHFQPKSVSAVAKAASLYAGSLTGAPKTKRVRNTSKAGKDPSTSECVRCDSTSSSKKAKQQVGWEDDEDNSDDDSDDDEDEDGESEGTYE